MDPRTKPQLADTRKMTERSEVRKEFRFAEYMFSTTGLQGPGKMWEAPYKLLKVLWLLAFLAAFVVMVIQLVELFRTFFSFPIKTSVTLGFNPLTLPALTLCNVNPIRLSRAKQLSCEIQDVLRLADDDKHPDCVTNPVSAGDCWGRWARWVVWAVTSRGQGGVDEYYQRRQQIATLLAQEKRETRMLVGHQLEDLIVTCSLFGRTCSFLNITSFLSKDYGNCYTIVHHDVKASQTGPETALDLTLNLEAEEFVTSFKTGYGVRVVLHEQGTRAFPSSEGITLSSGAEVNIGVRLTQITRMGGLYGDCEERNHTDMAPGYKYTIMNCRDQCLKRATLQQCQCVSPEDGVNTPNETLQYCATSQEFECVGRVYQDYYNSTEKGTDRCQCFNPCQSELVFSPTLSGRSWPVLSYVKTLEEQVCRARADSPKCGYTDQAFTVESADTRRASFARIRLYYERLNYEIVEETPFYNTERFLSDIGGTLGLWIGVTVLGLAEMLELLLLCLLSCCKRLKASNRLAP